MSDGMRRRTSVAPMLGQRLRRWLSIVALLGYVLLNDSAVSLRDPESEGVGIIRD